MATEIERKFLLAGDEWRAFGEGIKIRQGYLSTTAERTVRIRRAGECAFLTIKGRGDGIVRPEYEYEIPLADAEDMLEDLCEKPIIEKRRFKINHRGLIWEVDEFHGVNEGLILAEVELESPDQPIEKPLWIGREVSDDPRFYNANLVKRPFTTWRDHS